MIVTNTFLCFFFTTQQWLTVQVVEDNKFNTFSQYHYAQALKKEVNLIGVAFIKDSNNTINLCEAKD